MSDTYFTVIQELKAQLVIELRKNHALDRKLGKLGEFLIVFSHTLIFIYIYHGGFFSRPSLLDRPTLILIYKCLLPDKRIALLIKNRGNLQMVMANMKKREGLF